MWKLYVDDVRNPPDTTWIIARTSSEAIVICKNQKTMPGIMSLDHDLGGEDTIMTFLKELFEYWCEHFNSKETIPKYVVHSANPIGSKNAISFMESWKRSIDL